MSPPPAEAAPIDTRFERGSAIVADPGSGTKRVEVVRCHLEPRILPWGTVQEAHQTDRGLGRLLGLRTAFMDLDLLPALELVVVDGERPPETGGYQIEPAELARAYPLERSIQRSSNGASNDSQPGPATVEVDWLLDQISDLRETIRDLRDRLDASEAERRHESEEHRRVQERLTGLLTHRQAGSVPPVIEAGT